MQQPGICFLWPQGFARRLSRYRTHPHLPTAPIQHPAVPTAVSHTQEQHQHLPSTPTLPTPPPVWDHRCHLNIQEGQKCHRAPRAVDVTHLMGWKVVSRMGPHPGLALDNSVLLSSVLTNPGCSQKEKNVEELKLVQDPALASPGSLPGNCQ